MNRKDALLASVCLVVAVSVPAASYAQTQTVTPSPVTTEPQTESTVEEIVVTGFRRSLASAINVKRNAAAVVDSISAEDIGKFPDQNLAESLQRITGVQITRNRGEGQSVSIRGLDPSFNQINFNGRTLPSPSGSRSFDFTILSSEFVNGIDVYKSPTADLTEGGLAGTVNIRTLRPSDVTGRRGVFNVEGLYEENSEEITPHVSGLYADSFLDGRLNIVAAADYSERSLQTYRYEAFGLESGSEATRSPVQDYNRDGDTVDTFLFNHAATYVVDFGERTRESYLLSAGWKFTDNFDVYVEGLTSVFNNDIRTALNAHRFTNISLPNAVRASTIDSDGIIRVFDADGVDHRNNGRPIQYRDDLDTLTAGGRLQLGNFLITGEFSQSKAQRVATDVSLEVIARASVSQDITEGGANPASVVYQRGYDPLNRANWRALGLNGTYNQATTDEVEEARLDVDYTPQIGPFNSIKFGIHGTDRTFGQAAQALIVSAEQLAPLLGEAYSATIEGGSFAAGDYMVQYDFPNLFNGYNGSATFPTAFLSSDPQLVFDAVSLDELAARFGVTRDPSSTAAVQEKTNSIYARADFATEDDRLNGNIGVRYVNTEQTSNGFAPDLSLITFNQQGAQTIIPNATAVSTKQSYDELLPSLNLRYDLTETLAARFSAARVMTRPTLGLLSPRTLVSANVRTITRGNPNLKPYLSDQYDLTLEWYFQEGALLSLGGFYKDISNFVLNTTTSETLNITQVQGGVVPITFTAFQPQNGGESVVQGIEFNYQQPFTFLPAPFDGFGVLVNYTYVDAAPLQVVAGGPFLDLPGVSKNNYNLVAYYEKGPVGIRLSYNYRDAFVVDTASFFGDGQFTQAYDQLDLSASYNVTDNIELNIDALNIGNSLISNVNMFDVNRGLEDNGRRVTIGLRARF